MPDHTQHVLDAIDGALSDWSVSSDAMRWTPEPESASTIRTLPDSMQPNYLMARCAIRPVFTDDERRDFDRSDAMLYMLVSFATYSLLNPAPLIITAVI